MLSHTNESPAITALPAEIWLMIAGYSNSSQDLAAVSIVTRCLRNSVPIPACLIVCRDWPVLMRHYASFLPMYTAFIQEWNQSKDGTEFFGLISSAMEKNRDAFLDQLMSTEGFNPSLKGSWFLHIAAWYGKLDIVDRLLKDPRVDQNHIEAHIVALEKGHLDVLDRLMQSSKQMDPSAGNNQLLKLACERGHLELVKRLLKDKRVDPSKPYDFNLRAAAEAGHLEIVRLLLTDHRVNPAAGSNEAFGLAAAKGDLKLMQKLIKDHRVERSLRGLISNQVIERACQGGHLPAVEWLLKRAQTGGSQASGATDMCLRVAAMKGHADIVARLLKEPHLNPMESKGMPLRMASSGGHLSVIEVLLADPRVNPADYKNVAIKLAAFYGHVSLVERLLKDPRVDPFQKDNRLLYETIQQGHLNAVKALMLHPKADRTDQKLLMKAAENGHVDIVDYLVTKQRLNPSAKQCAAFRKAAEYGHLDVVERLLREKNVDPSAFHNEAIRFASKNGYTCVVQRLLKDRRVDPSACSNEALRKSAANGFLKVVEILLKHPSVDPSAMNNEAIMLSCEKGYQSIVECLLKHSKFSPSLSSSKQNFARICWESKRKGLMVLERLSADPRPAARSKRTRSTGMSTGDFIFVSVSQKAPVILEEPESFLPEESEHSCDSDCDDDAHESDCSCEECQEEHYVYDDYDRFDDYDLYDGGGFDDYYADYYGLL